MRIYSARALVWDGPTFASATSALEHWQPLSLTLIGRACIESADLDTPATWSI
jgi:hypothetical protein